MTAVSCSLSNFPLTLLRMTFDSKKMPINSINNFRAIKERLYHDNVW